MTRRWARTVLDFWFGQPPELWFRGGEEFDEEIRELFYNLWDVKRSEPVENFLGSAEEALAGVILFDQFPRNMFRDHADQFSTDHLAIAIAKAAIDRGFDDGMTTEQRAFLYMPYQHSERMADQVQSLLLYSALGDPQWLHYARLHHEVIERFGRFPHRNPILGRKPTAMERDAGDVVPW